MTLGERFRKIRSDRRISLREVSRSTKIQVKYLEAIEEGAYDRLPAEVYVKGFLRSYATHLGVPEEAILRLYDRERNIQKNLGQVDNPRIQPSQPVRFSLSPSPKMIVVSLGILVAVGFFSYLSFELRSFVSEPRLVIESPLDGETVNDSEVLVSGRTDPRAEVRINGDEVVVDEEGVFFERLTLSGGLNTITVSSMNRFGKVRERVLSVDAVVPEVMEGVGTDILANAGVERSTRLSIRVTEEVTLTVITDGETVWNGEMSPDEKHSFSAANQIVVSADRGSAALIRFGDADEEELASNEDPARVVFDPDGRVRDDGVVTEGDESGGSNME